MENKTIKISEENYRWLLGIASDMQREYGKPFTFDAAINSLKKGKTKEKKDIMDLAGRWKMSDKEADEFLKDIKRGWENWKIQSL